MGFSVELPEYILKKAEKLKVYSVDIEERFVRGSGAGGQKVNKTSNCVWLKHLPTGTEVKCQRHRERGKNRTSAYKLLVNKIETMKLGVRSEAAKQNHKIRKQKQRRSRRSKEKMLQEKSKRSEVKALRKTVDLCK